MDGLRAAEPIRKVLDLEKVCVYAVYKKSDQETTAIPNFLLLLKPNYLTLLHVAAQLLWHSLGIDLGR